MNHRSKQPATVMEYEGLKKVTGFALMTSCCWLFFVCLPKSAFRYRESFLLLLANAPAAVVLWQPGRFSVF
jgi:hypothetical protein